MGTVLRHGSDAQKQTYLPRIATGELRLQAFGVTEPSSGTDTLSLQTTARKTDDGYIVNGQKIWTSRAEYSDLMLLWREQHPRSGGQAHRRAFGLSAQHERSHRQGDDDTSHPHHDQSCDDEIFFDDLHIPADSLIGEEAKAFAISSRA